MKIDNSIQLDYDDVLIRPQRTTLSSRKDVILDREFHFYHSPRVWKGIPIICSNLACLAGKDVALALAKNNIITCLHKYHTKEDLLDIFNDSVSCINIPYIWPTIGYSELERDLVLSAGDELPVQFNICIDVANAHIDKIVEFCASVRKESPRSIIMAGNVGIPECAQELIIHGGVDIIKGGTGSGNLCRTRVITGVGVPQLSLNIECSSSVHGLKNGDKKLGLFCSDGGCKTVGDVCKSFASGSDFSMLGSMFNGCSESCGEWIETKQNEFISNYLYLGKEYTVKYLKSYGMSSCTAQKKFGTEKEYRASEGVEEKLVKHKGPVQNIVNDILGGLRSCCTYVGATSLKDLSKCTTFLIRVK